MVATTLHAMLLRSRMLKPAIRRGVGATSCLGASGRGVAASGRGVGEMKKSNVMLYVNRAAGLRLPELSSAERQSVRYDESVRRRDREEKT